MMHAYNNHSNDSHHVSDTETIFEAVRRYQLPFGVAGKLRSCKNATEDLAKSKINALVLLDYRILTPAEYIFGLVPGDCISLSVDILNYRVFDAAQVDFLTRGLCPANLIIAAHKKTIESISTIEEFTSKLMGQSLCLSGLKHKSGISVHLCSVDEDLRQVFFFQPKNEG